MIESTKKRIAVSKKTTEVENEKQSFAHQPIVAIMLMEVMMTMVMVMMMMMMMTMMIMMMMRMMMTLMIMTMVKIMKLLIMICLLYTSPSPRD